MSTQYRLTADQWRDLSGVQHKRGDIVTPTESDIPRLLRARAIAPLDDVTDDPDAADQGAAQVEAERVAAEKEAAAVAAAQAPSKVPDRPKLIAPDPAWIAYATARGVAVDGLDKDAIIAAVDELDKK